MAESIVTFVLAKLADATVQELLHLCGVDKQVKLVSDELGWIQAFLKDTDRKNYNGDERQRHWVKEIREVAYDIEDIIDKACLLGIEMDDLKKRHSKREALKRIFRSPKTIPALHELGVEINEILERIQKISESREKYGTSNFGEGGGGQIELPVRRLLVPDFDDPDVVGFDQDRVNIVKQLLDDNVKRRCVVSIVGPGGLGKTTLARKVYNSRDVKTTFDLRILITVCQKVKLVDTLRKLIEEVRGRPVDANKQGQQAEYFHRELYKSLLEKKYLVVLDDVWEDNNLWVQIEEAFPDSKNGSRVLMTTRFFSVAKSADSAHEPYTLSYLTEEHSLALLLKKALPNQDPHKGYPNNLFELAKEFIKKCGGLPLALIVLGGLLSMQPPDDHSWRKVMQKMNWLEDANKVLVTSFDDLPFALKSCFMYFALFPEDYQIDGRALIRMWVAEGFIPHNDNGGTLEDTAENFLEDLVQRSMVQVKERASNGSIRSCYIHDVLHEIATKKAEEENFLTTCSNPDDQKISGARRVSFHHWKCDELMKDSSPSLRSLLCFEGIPNLSIHRRQLKVLSDMGNYWDAPRENDRYEMLAGLRYLKLTDVDYFKDYIVGSKSISFLQTLDLRFVPCAVEVPDSIWQIKTLRHVLLTNFPYTSGPPPSVELPNLHTLAGVKPRLSWKDQELPNLRSLRELHMEVEDEFPWELVVTFIGTLKHLETLTVQGLKPKQDNEISEKFEHVYFNQEFYY